MPDFEIYFHGLVCFFAPEARNGNRTAPKTMALFVRDNDHERMVLTADGERHFPGFNTISMTVTGGPQGVIDATDAGFQSDVPHLGDDTVSRAGTVVDPALAIQLAFPPIAGRLFAASRYESRGSYQLGHVNVRRDVARITLLTFSADAVSITCDGQTIEVNPGDGFVVLANDSEQGGISTTGDICGNHFRRYAFIMRTPTGAQANCAAVAHVIDDGNNSPSIHRGLHLDRVLALESLKVKASAPTQLNPGLGEHGPDNIDDPQAALGVELEPESAAHQVVGPTLTQTQCSNTNWP